MPLRVGLRETNTEHTLPTVGTMLQPTAGRSEQLPAAALQAMAAQVGTATHAARQSYSVNPGPSDVTLPAPPPAHV
jgi:hypothetical protein